MPTFYVSNINPASTALGTAGAFTGSATTQPTTNSSTRTINITTSTAQAFFKFYSDEDLAGDSDTTTTDVTGVGGVTGTFTFSTPDTTRSDEFVQLLANDVFGSNEAGDFFTNLTALRTSWNTAAGTTALASLNSKTSSAGAAASKELVDAMFLTSNDTEERFTMAYGSSVSAGTVTSGTGYAVTGGASQTGSPSVDVTMTGSTINNITLNTTGGGFVKGDLVTITQSAGNTLDITLNSVQAAMLNGTLDVSTGTEVPLETGDVIRVLYTIASESGQTDVSGDAITTTQTFFVDYTLN